MTSNPQVTGTVGATQIIAELGGGLNPTALQSITVGATAYVRALPPGFPAITPPGPAYGTIAAAQGTIAPGATVLLPVPEATALIGGGFATSNGLHPAGEAGGA